MNKRKIAALVIRTVSIGAAISLAIKFRKKIAAKLSSIIVEERFEDVDLCIQITFGNAAPSVIWDFSRAKEDGMVYCQICQLTTLEEEADDLIKQSIVRLYDFDEEEREELRQEFIEEVQQPVIRRHVDVFRMKDGSILWKPKDEENINCLQF